MEVYTWNLYNFINQRHSNKFHKIFLKRKKNADITMVIQHCPGCDKQENNKHVKKKKED